MDRRTLLTVSSVLGAAAVAAKAQTPASEAKYHAVFQHTEPEGAAWGTMITHVQNVQKALGTQGGCEIEVVFYGPGLNMLKRPNRYEAALRELTEAGVTLAACQNAMRVMKLTSADLFDFATEVDSGISELIRKQTAGWAYIH